MTMKQKKQACSTFKEYKEKHGHKPANPMHLDACIQGGSIVRNRKKYTRKLKHKNKSDDFEF